MFLSQYRFSFSVTAGVGVGAEDPIQFAIDTIQQAPQKTLQYHVKDRAPDGGFADLGEGTIDFRRIFRATRPLEVEEYIVENDQPVDPRLTTTSREDA